MTTPPVIKRIVDRGTCLPSEALTRAAQSLIDYPNDQRHQPRSAATMPCYVLKVDEQDQPVGEPIPMVTLDISTTGI